MTYGMKIKMRGEVRCGHCDAAHVEEYDHIQGFPHWNVGLPASWRVLDGVPVCDRHEVVVRDKDVPVNMSFTVGAHEIDAARLAEKVAEIIRAQVKMAMPDSGTSIVGGFLNDDRPLGMRS